MTLVVILKYGLATAITAILLIWLAITANHVPTSNTTLNAPPISYVFSLANKQIPIPQQTWIEAANAKIFTQLSKHEIGLDSKLMFHVKNNVVTAFILAHANTAPSTTGWGISKDCKNSAHLFAAVFDYKDNNYKCSFVAKSTAPAATPIWLQAKSLAIQRNWHLSSQWTIVGIRVADRLDVVDVRYGFNFPIDDDTTSRALVEWQIAALYWVERGFRNQLEFETQLPMPTLTTNATASNMMAASRLHRLKQLYAQGWLTELDFITQRNLIQQSIITQADLTVDIWQLGALKTAGHTTQSLFWMWGVNYLFLGNAYVAGSLAIAKSLISPIRYYALETAWNTWGPRRNPILPVIDF
jgi:uncharacterized membrane protein